MGKSQPSACPDAKTENAELPGKTHTGKNLLKAAMATVSTHQSTKRMGEGLSPQGPPAIPSVIQWHREKELRLTILKVIVANITKEQPTGAKRITRMDQVRAPKSYDRLAPPYDRPKSYDLPLKPD